MGGLNSLPEVFIVPRGILWECLIAVEDGVGRSLLCVNCVDLKKG